MSGKHLLAEANYQRYNGQPNELREGEGTDDQEPDEHALSLRRQSANYNEFKPGT
jgi:hypothetical protein